MNKPHYKFLRWQEGYVNPATSECYTIGLYINQFGHVTPLVRPPLEYIWRCINGEDDWYHHTTWLNKTQHEAYIARADAKHLPAYYLFGTVLTLVT